MTGLKIQLPLVFTDKTLPVLRDDPMIPDKGALFLSDPSHPMSPWTGVPGNGVATPNLVEKQLRALWTPTAGDEQLRGRNTVPSTFYGFRELSGRGGYHLAHSQTPHGTSTSVAAHLLPAGVADYLGSKQPNHAVFVGLVGRWTRSPLGLSAGAQTHSGWLGTGGSGWTFYTRPSGAGETEYPNDTRRVGFSHVNVVPPQVGPMRQSITTSSWYASGSGVVQSPSAIVIGDQSGADGKSGSFILYRYYIEDLTVSGRSHAQVEALLEQWYADEVLTAGGRYYGDTFTDPATITV